ncbi:MAG TPA: PAS domain S-box protein [Kofleriaceae bacterium]
MFGPTTTAAKLPPRDAVDPYRVLFQHLSAGAARCRLVIEREQVVGAEILDSNRAFEPLRATLPQLLELFSRIRRVGAPETLSLRSGGALLSISGYPAGDDEVMVVIEDVTTREQLEQRSRQSQDRFEQAFHGNAAAMVIAHPGDLRILDVNPRWLEMFGATRAEVIGRTSVELGLISEIRASARIAEHRQFTDGYDVELELRTRAGANLTVLASAQPIEIAEGRCTLTTLLNITDRKHAEEAFAVAFSASPAGMILVDDASDIVVAVNNRLLEMTGDRREALVGRRARELSLIARPPREELFAEIARSGRLAGVEVDLACKAGPPISTLASTERVTLHDRPHRLTVFTDITGRKQLERRLLTQHVVGHRLAAAGDPEAAIPGVLEALCRGEGWDCGAAWLSGGAAAGDSALPCGVWRPRGIPDELASALRGLGASPGGLVGRVIATRTAEELELADTACRAVAFPILGGDAVLGVVAMVARARDGSASLDTAARGLFDAVGRLLGLFVERTRAEASVRVLNTELERRVLERTHALETSNRDLEAFSFSVSHDLRAPLRAIHGFSEILLDDFAAELPEPVACLIGRVHASATRMRKLVEDLLAFSRLGRDGLRLGCVELDPLVRSVLDELLVGRELGARLELRVMPLGVCRADASLLRTVWTNLIDNALKYSRNRARIVIEIGREVRDHEIVYFVKDNGVGFDMEHADRLFGVFQRLHSDGDFEGTGIGLANIRRIIEHHGGRVAAISELGRGSKFEFTLGTEVS